MRAPHGREYATLTALKSIRPRRAAAFFGSALFAIRKGRSERLIRSIVSASRMRARCVILAAEAVQTDAEFTALAELYVILNQAEIDVGKTPAIAEKAASLARAIRNVASKQRIDALRRMFGRIDLKESARDIVLALLTHGDVDDVTAVLLKIGGVLGEMRYENHVELCLAGKDALLKSSRGIPSEYASWIKSRNFWVYFNRTDIRTAEASAVLPLRNQGNRLLFIRLLAHATLGLVHSIEDELLNLLLRHSFKTVSGAAAIRMAELVGDRALDLISNDVDGAIARGRAGILASAIRAAEESLYLSHLPT